jgi:hypothetical protein
VITTFPDGSEARTAMEQLGGSLADEGRLGEAEQALRETLRMCAQSPAGRSGTSGIAELRLAEVILAGDDAGRSGEAASLLEAIRPHVQTQRFLRDVVFRYLPAGKDSAKRLTQFWGVQILPAAYRGARGSRQRQTSPGLLFELLYHRSIPLPS